MASIQQSVTLNDKVIGKKGRAYTRAEMATLLEQYRAYNSTGDKLSMFRQLHELAAREDLRKTRQRKQILRRQIPSAGSGLVSTIDPQHPLLNASPRIPTAVSDSNVVLLQNQLAPSEVDRERLNHTVSAFDDPRNLAVSPTADSSIAQLQSQDTATTEEKLCSVCAEEKLPNMFPAHKITTGCTHETEVCTACLQRCIESQMEQKAWNSLECPICRQRLSFKAVRAHCSTECFERYVLEISGVRCFGS
jgi:hypothetical protein